VLVVVVLRRAGPGGVLLVGKGFVMDRAADRGAVVGDRGLGLAGRSGAQGDQGGAASRAAVAAMRRVMVLM
jgi:hypothetical protein